MKVIASSIRKGNVIEQDGKLYVVLTAENIHPGKGTPVSQIEMRRISDGVKISERYKTTDQVEKATIEDQNFNYLYEDADGFHFMNNENYDQVQVPKDVVGTAAPYLQENMTVKLSLHGVIPVAIQMPQRATLEVVETEPVTKGQTASSSYKPAILSNGVRTCVPPHVGDGNADRGHDRGRVLRRARQGLGAYSAHWRRGATHWVRKLSGSLRVGWHLSFCSLPARRPSAADEFRTPAISAVRVEWRAALDQLRSEINALPAVASAFTFSGQRRLPASDPRSTPALVQLNAVTSPDLHRDRPQPGSGAAAVRHRGFLEARLNGAPANLSVSRYQADFRPVDLFDAGPAGYDAMFSLEPGAGDGMPQRTFAKPVEVQITGSILIYDIADPLGGKGEPVKALAAQFPDLRRFIREGYVRYAFTRFGVPYVVSIQCLDSTPRARRLACREAYPVAERFLKALRIAGGLPSRPRMDIPSGVAERPPQRSPDFTYRPSGDIIARSGSRKQGGHADLTAYSQIRFRWRKPRPSSTRNPSEAASRATNRLAAPAAIPGRTISARPAAFGVGQCAGGFGHQGQDIRAGALSGRQRKRRSAAIPSSRPSSRFATAS